MSAMLRYRSLLKAFALALGIALAGTPLAYAGVGAFPVAVGGQKLPSLAPVIARVSPAVVNISSTSHHILPTSPFFSDPFMRQFFGLPAEPLERELVQQSLGSGVIVNAAKGYILTNNHVIAGAADIKVTLTDGRSYKAKVIGADPVTDLAVIQIHAPNLVALPFADSADLRVGDFVIAIGDPFGLGQSATFGIISGLQRQDLRRNGVQDYIQTDASINPGNSGGALVNLAGELVGINSMIYSPSGASAGLGFAIPSNLDADVMHQLIAHGRIIRGNLGVVAQNLTPRVAAALGVDATHGALIANVLPDSDAADAGLRPGDLIVAVDGRPIRDAQDLRNAELLAPAGSTLALTIDRSGRTSVFDVKLTPVAQQIAGATLDRRLAGVVFSDQLPTRAPEQINGVVVQSVMPESQAATAGLTAGDILVAVDNMATPDLTQLRRAFAMHPRNLVLTVMEQGQILQLQLGSDE
ncbi:MAG TPA: Do family serine endopeptidase [Rhodanobacteraceae bacterium]